MYIRTNACTPAHTYTHTAAWATTWKDAPIQRRSALQTEVTVFHCACSSLSWAHLFLTWYQEYARSDGSMSMVMILALGTKEAALLGASSEWK